MVKSDIVKEYSEYLNKEFYNDGSSFDRYDVFLKICKIFSIKKALYPGSYIHITPSMIIPEVVYIDSVKNAKKFFKNDKDIIDFIDENKIYKEDTKINFISSDYNKEIKLRDDYDLLISFYAGFVSIACKKYLKKGGILIVNDSHGDATIAKLDTDFEFIGVMEYKQGEYKYIDFNLEKYFKFKRERKIDIEKVKKTMKGPKYKYLSEYYIFKKI